MTRYESLVFSLELSEDLVREIHVGVDVLHVIRLLEGVDEAEDLLRVVGLQRHVDGSTEIVIRVVDLNASLGERVLDGRDIARGADNLKALAQVVDLFGTSVEHGHEDVILGQLALGHEDQAGAGEHVGHGTGLTQVAAVLGHRGAHVRGRTVAVIGKALDEHGHAVRAVALVHDGLPVCATGLFAGAALAGTLDIVVRDGGLLGLLDHVVEGRVRRRIATTSPSRNLDVLDQLGKFLAALGVVGCLLVLRGSPFGVAGHGPSPFGLANFSRLPIIRIYAWAVFKDPPLTCRV